MTYKVTSTEKTMDPASTHETKALLYVMNFDEDGKNTEFFIVDFFNDLSSCDSFGESRVDIQSKANKNVSGKAIGRDLVTLFKNYISEFEFDKYILFLGGVSQTVRIDDTLDVFLYDNVTSSSKKSIKAGLTAECEKKTYIDKSLYSSKDIDTFLSEVVFVIDVRSKVDYVREVVKVNSKNMPNDEFLNKVFKEIRDEQTVKKNINTENVVLTAFTDFQKYLKYITKNDIKMLVLSRMLGATSITKGTPTSFSECLDGTPIENRKEIVEESRNDVFRMLFDKNNADEYWKLFNTVYQAIVSFPKHTIEELYEKLGNDVFRPVKFLNFMSAKFFISIVKDGILNED